MHISRGVCVCVGGGGGGGGLGLWNPPGELQKYRVSNSNTGPDPL